MTLSEKALQVAISQIGVEEKPHGSNAGPEVEAYLKSVGLPKGNSWCMAFLYWCFKQAADSMGVKNSMLATGGVLFQWNQRRNIYRVHGAPGPGDVFIMDYGKGLGHTGIVESVEPDYVHTIEGNTNDDGSREGYEVCRRKRPRNKIVGYLRFG